MDVVTAKIAVIGAAKAGKTALVSTLCRGNFAKDYEGTVGLETSTKRLYLPAGSVRERSLVCESLFRPWAGPVAGCHIARFHTGATESLGYRRTFSL